MPGTEEASPQSVDFGISKETLLEILRLAASQDRTVVEFHTTGEGENRSLSKVMEITDHVDELESKVN